MDQGGYQDVFTELAIKRWLWGCIADAAWAEFVDVLNVNGVTSEYAFSIRNLKVVDKGPAQRSLLYCILSELLQKASHEAPFASVVASINNMGAGFIRDDPLSNIVNREMRTLAAPSAYSTAVVSDCAVALRDPSHPFFEPCKGITGAKLMSSCDIRRLSGLRDGEWRTALEALIKVLPEIRVFTIADALELTDLLAWGHARDTLMQVQGKCGQYFWDNDPIVREIRAAFVEQKAEILSGLAQLHNRDVDKLCACILDAHASVGPSLAASLGSAKECMNTLVLNKPNLDATRMRTLTASDNDPSLKAYEEMRCLAMLELQVLYRIASQALDTAISTDRWALDDLAVLKKMCMRTEVSDAFTNVRTGICSHAIARVAWRPIY
jgi:hypothetical protein